VGHGVSGGVSNKGLVLAAMVFAVAMTFIDQTIVAIAIPSLQKDLSLTATGSQWIINGYLLALSALFAFGGKLGDVLGHRRMVVVAHSIQTIFYIMAGVMAASFLVAVRRLPRGRVEPADEAAAAADAASAAGAGA
jgi:MFS family permease